VKDKKPWVFTLCSLLPCVLHAVMLHTRFNGYAYTSGAKIALFLLGPAAYLALSQDRPFRDLFRGAGNGKALKLPLILGFSAFAAIAVIFAFLRPFLDREMILGALEHNGITGKNFPLVFVYVVLINAALEELFFRGFIFIGLRRAGRNRAAYGVSALLFALYHMAILNNALAPGMFVFCIAGLVAAGWLFSALTVRSGGIAGSLIVHVSANLALNLIVVYYYLTR